MIVLWARALLCEANRHQALGERIPPVSTYLEEVVVRGNRLAAVVERAPAY